MHSLDVWHWNWNLPHDDDDDEDDFDDDIGEEAVDVVIMSANLIPKGGDTVVVGVTTSAFLVLTEFIKKLVSITFQDMKKNNDITRERHTYKWYEFDGRLRLTNSNSFCESFGFLTIVAVGWIVGGDSRSFLETVRTPLV
jgi:hypothetical protein